MGPAECPLVHHPKLVLPHSHDFPHFTPSVEMLGLNQLFRSSFAEAPTPHVMVGTE